MMTLQYLMLACGAVRVASGQLQSIGIVTPGQQRTTTESSASFSTTLPLPPSSSASVTPTPTSSTVVTTTGDLLLLTTVFTQPTDCATGVTEIAAWSTELWQNIVNPLPSLTLTSCYPSQFYHSAVATTVLPPFKELVCPLNWESYHVNSTYLICCPNGYGLWAPNYLSANRPGLGAVCTSSVWPNVLLDITSYDGTALATTIAATAGVNGTMVFATAFDGTMAPSIATTSPSSQSTVPTSPITSRPPTSTKATTSKVTTCSMRSTSLNPKSSTSAAIAAISQLPPCGVSLLTPLSLLCYSLLGVTKSLAWTWQCTS
ncbi:Hypothetical protein R9X50_00296800 [Acrodontium crateriforme]|uniref:Uncharacterized protein n=1 Tax=Acrodontium crateriforme TaxID=150365 RepID=A0AAQ3M2D9_9PEZI|nr:Hypothetical protein R9X50_00296800 [Acrodontium crateriforme]